MNIEDMEHELDSLRISIQSLDSYFHRSASKIELLSTEVSRLTTINEDLVKKIEEYELLFLELIRKNEELKLSEAANNIIKKRKNERIKTKFK